jgi:hypothetical protein
MTRLARRFRVALVLGDVGVALLAACSNPLGLAPATSTNEVDTVTLYAVQGTGLNSPSAYAIIGRTAILTQQTAGWDFVFSYDSLNRPAFYPTGALPKYAIVDSVLAPGFQVSNASFDNTSEAPVDGYVTDKPALLSLQAVLLARSKSETCPDGTVYPLYAKIQPIAFDSVARSVTFLVLADQNCGYRSLVANSLPSQ